MKYKHLLFLSFIILLLANETKAQKGYELGGWVGISNYFGDLNTSFDLSKPGIAAGANFRYLFNERLAYKASLNHGQVRADDKDSNNSFDNKRNLSFKSILIDLTNQFEFNFLPYVHGSSDYFTPYVAVGLNVFYYNPKAKYEGEWYNLRELGTEGQALGEEYYQYSAGLVVGGGLKWDITHKLSMNFEMTYRYIFTDYLDDVSTTYPNIGELNSLRGQDAVNLTDRSGIPGFGDQGNQRGNSRDNDNFSFIGVSMMYYFGSLECPPINRYQF